jgi:hypothetical protein
MRSERNVVEATYVAGDGIEWDLTVVVENCIFDTGVAVGVELVEFLA